MRGEFLLIQTAFDHMPSITTTGLFATVFNQFGNLTFNLPAVAGTFATTANVATETTRATAAEAAEATARTAAVGAETTRATAAEALLAPTADPVLTGRPSVQNATFTSYYLKNTASATDSKIFDWSTDTSSIDFRFVKDDYSGATGWLKAVRSGSATISVTVTAPTINLVGTATSSTAAPGTNTTQLATTAFSAAAVAVETARATAAEATKQAALGYTPVQQGTGIGQGPNAVKIGWSGSKPKMTVDVSDLGNIAMEPWTTSAIAAAAPFGTLNNVTASRALGTTYTNTNGVPVFLNVATSGTGTPFSIHLVVNGTQMQAPGGTGSGIQSVSFILSPGATYSVSTVSGSNTLQIWTETF